MKAPRLIAVVGVVGAVTGFGAVVVGCDDPFQVPPVPDPITATISLEKRGDGPSAVSSVPGGLVCDFLCAGAEASFDDVDSLDVVIEPSRDSQFIRAFCTAVGQETVSVDVLDGGRARLTLPTIVAGDDGDVGVDWRCVAELRLVNTLQVIVATGTGTGRVTGTLAASLDDDTIKRIDCPGDCVGGYFVDETETLVATADPGSVFGGWDFCSDSLEPTIDVVMSGDANCDAIFNLAP